VVAAAGGGGEGDVRDAVEEPEWGELGRSTCSSTRMEGVLCFTGAVEEGDLALCLDRRVD
jgi:hypothetical protein